MSDTPDTFKIGILEPEANRGYLPQAIPVPRDDEIVALLSRVMTENRVGID